MLTAEAGGRADVCGLAVGNDAGFPSYTYFHRREPLVFIDRLVGHDGEVNYAILRKREAVGALFIHRWAEVATRGDLGLYRRDGSCEPFAGYREIFPRADFTGLHPLP